MTHPKIAGVMVPKSKMVKLYQQLADDGFTEIEEFDHFMEPRKDLLKKSLVPATMQDRLNRHEPDYWQAARAFLYEWSGWHAEKYKKKPYLRRAWELHCQDAASTETIAKLITYEGVMEGTGYKVSSRTVKLHLQNLKNELIEWIRINNYLKSIGEL